MKTITEQAAQDSAEALTNIATSIQGIDSALQGIDSTLVEHRHTWVFLRQEHTIRKATPAMKEIDSLHTAYTQVDDLYYCSGCPELRRIHMEDMLDNPTSFTGQPRTRFWHREIPE